MGNAPDSVKRLVDHFDLGRKVFLSGDYKEEQLRAEFLNPFFESLGWNVANKAGLTEVFKPVVHEESTKAQSTTTPDSAEGLDDIFAYAGKTLSTRRRDGY